MARTSQIESLILIILSCCLLLTGCAADGKKSDGRRTRAEGVAAGAVAGAVVGGLVAGREGALLGAGLGGVAGGLIGDHVAKKKEKYANKEDELIAAVERADKLTDQIRQYNNNLSKEVVGLERSIAALQTEKQNMAQVSAQKKQAALLLKDTEEKVQIIKKEVSSQNVLLARWKKKGPSDGLMKVSNGISGLRSSQNDLELLRDRLRLISRTRIQ